ncbi:hypothetical protein PR003_g2492 [Phytophthora rubi]|uniref:Uncharacterized protein n=1 Tax=Phytophthora rubi TaxID=129364 RepID=A0A6A4G5S8_9STRA|nr:hypothetical protein PR003_g2492 [Phytophthora rubi]
MSPAAPTESRTDTTETHGSPPRAAAIASSASEPPLAASASDPAAEPPSSDSATRAGISEPSRSA